MIKSIEIATYIDQPLDPLQDLVMGVRSENRQYFRHTLQKANLSPFLSLYTNQ